MEKSYVYSDMRNGDGVKYGVVYFFFPITEGYPVGNPDDFRRVSGDIWNQTYVEVCESLEDVLSRNKEYQSDL